MPYCPECGKEIKRVVKFCPECGTRLAPAHPPTKPALPKGKPTPKPRAEGKGWTMGKKVAVLSIVCTIGVVAIVLILLFSGRGAPTTGIITTDPSAMMPTSTDLPGWTMSEGRYVSIENHYASISLPSNASLYRATYDNGTHTLYFYVTKLSSIEEANSVWHTLTPVQAYSVSVGEESVGQFPGFEWGLDEICVRKSNVIAMVDIFPSSFGSSVSQGMALPYAQILESKIS